MSRKYAIRDQNAIYFVTLTVVYWLDVFIRDTYKEIIIESLKYCMKNKGLNVHAYCIMTSHVHLILSVKEGYELSDILRDFKSYTSKNIRECIQNNQQESKREIMLWLFERAGKKNQRNLKYQFWQQHNHPIELSTNKMLEQRLNYVHNNPVEAGFVFKPEDWVWSSACQYAGQEGMVSINFIE